jgi:hypothetical protein
MSGDEPDLNDDQLVRLFTDWLEKPFEVHPALLRLLVRRYLALVADAAKLQSQEPRSQGRPNRAWTVYFAVGRHLANGTPPAAAHKLVAADMKISVNTVRQHLRRVRRQMSVDLDGYPLDPDHPWFDPNHKPRWR